MLKRTTRIAPIGRRRRGDGYSTLKRAYLREHPLCQGTIAHLGLHEPSVLLALSEAKHGDPFNFVFQGYVIPAAVDVHHRNKSNGPRRCDVRWFLAVSRVFHDLIEDNKTWAREIGLLLPINADTNGVGGGRVNLTTEEFMLLWPGKGFSLPLHKPSNYGKAPTIY